MAKQTTDTAAAMEEYAKRYAAAKALRAEAERLAKQAERAARKADDAEAVAEAAKAAAGRLTPAGR